MALDEMTIVCKSTYAEMKKIVQNKLIWFIVKVYACSRVFLYH